MQTEPSQTLPLSDDLRFLVACCQAEPSQADIGLIKMFLSTQHLALAPEEVPLGDSTLIGLANQHGVIPLVYKTLKKLDEKNLLNATGYMLHAFQDAYMQIARRNMLMSAELLRIMKLLEENGIEALAFKGPALAQQAYGDITMRQFGDLDILVNEEKIVAAGDILSAHGYNAEDSVAILQNKTCRRVINDLRFRHETNGALIEMHWRLFMEKLGRHLEYVQIGKNSRTVTLSGRDLLTLSPEMLLVYLCLHGSKHAWERLEWICDIDRLLRAEPNLDWDETLKIAGQMETLTTLGLGLKLCSALFDTSLPEAVASMTRSDRIAQLAADTYSLMDTLCKQEGYAKYSHIHLYQMGLLDTRMKKVKHLLATYFAISRNDCLELPLPTSLSFLYLLLKPYRVALKLIRTGRKHAH